MSTTPPTSEQRTLLKKVSAEIRQKMADVHRSRMVTAFYLAELRVVTAVAEEGYSLDEVEMIPEEMNDGLMNLPTGYYAGFKVQIPGTTMSRVHTFPKSARIRIPVHPQ